VANKLQVTPAECKRRAAECRKMAENAPSPHVRDTLADIERMWNRLAVETEVSQAMVSRFLGGAAFGPDEIAIMTGAYEAGLKQINVSGHNDVAAEALAQTIVRGRYFHGEPRDSDVQSWSQLSVRVALRWRLRRRPILSQKSRLRAERALVCQGSFSH
jgi:hypothetical protein